jgi:hypothetical protein
MTKRFRGKNRNSFLNRILSCIALVLYSLALIAMPVMHVHGCEHDTDSCCGHSHSVPTLDNGEVCPICEFAHLTVPFFTVTEPLLGQSNTVFSISLPVSIPPVIQIAALPPSRAPPVIC